MLARKSLSQGWGIALTVLLISISWSDGARAGLFGPDTPEEKLSDALNLAAGPGRISKARQLIEDARAECEKTGDKACQAEVYRVYALLERSGATKDVILMYGGIYAKNPTSENIDRARPYFDKAIELATEAQSYELVANVNYELVVNEKMRGTPLAGCIYVDRLQTAAKQAQQLHPDRHMSLPP